MTLLKWAAAIATGRGGSASSASSAGSEPYDPDYSIAHPHQVYNITATSTPLGSATPVNDRREEMMLKRFFKVSFHGADLFESKNIYVDSSGDAVGVVAQRDALVGLTSVDWYTERERDASARGTEVNFVSDYGVFELDDAHGHPILFDATAPATST